MIAKLLDMSFPSVFNIEHQNPTILKSLNIFMLDLSAAKGYRWELGADAGMVGLFVRFQLSSRTFNQ